MTPFLAAQACDPFDPTPMLIHADCLEEFGDQVGAEVLRSLVTAGAWWASTRQGFPIE